MTHDALLVVHVAAGAAGLLLGPSAVIAARRQRWRAQLAVAYQVAILVVASSAVGLAVLAWQRLWWLTLIAVITEAAALGGLWTARRRLTGWPAWQMRLLGGSYVALVTALLVVSWGGPLSWILPVVVGTAVIERTTTRARPAAHDRGSVP